MSKLYVDEILPSSSSNIKINNGLGITIGSNTTPSLIFDSVGGIVLQQPYWNIVEEQANNTNGHAGATFTSGDWRTRFLNTTRGSNTITGSSLLSNQFTLPSGTYRIFATAPSYYTGNHKIRLRNITDSSDTLLGTNERSAYSGVNDASQTFSMIRGIFTITSSKTFEIQHRCQNTQGTTGFGYAMNFGVTEVYTQVELWKIGN
jgi:hypothetical protein